MSDERMCEVPALLYYRRTLLIVDTPGRECRKWLMKGGGCRIRCWLNGEKYLNISRISVRDGWPESPTFLVSSMCVYSIVAWYIILQKRGNRFKKRDGTLGCNQDLDLGTRQRWARYSFQCYNKVVIHVLLV